MLKVEYIVKEIELAASLTKSKQRRTTIGKILKMMAPLCFVYEVGFRNLAEEDKRGPYGI